MPGIAVYWLLVGLAGALVVDAVPFGWRPVERWAAAAVVGVVSSTILSFGLSLWLGVGPGAALLGPAAVICLAVAVRAAGVAAGDDAVAQAPRDPGHQLATPAIESPKLASMKAKSVRMSLGKAAWKRAKLWNDAERGFTRTRRPSSTFTR